MTRTVSGKRAIPWHVSAYRLALTIAEEIYYECLYEGDLEGLSEEEQVTGMVEFYNEHYSKLPGIDEVNRQISGGEGQLVFYTELAAALKDLVKE